MNYFATHFKEYLKIKIPLNYLLFIPLLFLLMADTLAASQPAKAKQGGREIMVMVDERPDGFDRKSEIKMTLTNRRNRQRVREIVSFKKEYGKDSKKLMYFKKPADVKGTSFLTWDYDEIEKDDDKWLYMPALRRVRRISGSSNNDYFMGTDFTYDDMGDRNVDEDRHTLLREEKADGIDCWVVESVPLGEDELYTKKILWVRKDALVTIKTEYFDKNGLMKIFRVTGLEKISGFWTITKMEMENIVEEHKTEMEIKNTCYNQNLKDSLFKVAAISKGKIR